jgi:Domain of unknown function (DUF4263)
LDILASAADGLESLLNTRGGDPESVFHDYLFANPILLDVYGLAESKPRFICPPGDPLGKTHVEPDFILKYPNLTYRLIELERPSHNLGTKQGHPPVGVTHAAYQIAEWTDYISRNYQLISARYPGIAGSYTSTIVIGRNSLNSIGNAKDVAHHKSLLRGQLNVNEVLTYDDLIEKARAAIRQLDNLVLSAPSE